MIGLGLSLCGACVMADVDPRQQKPMYDSATTRGYYIAAHIPMPRADSVSPLFVKTLECKESDVVQRGVVFSSSLYYERGMSLAPYDLVNAQGYLRDARCVFWKGSGSRVARIGRTGWNSDIFYAEPPHFGYVDFSVRNNEASVILRDGENRWAASGKLMVNTEGVLSARALIARTDLPQDALFMMSYTMASTKICQLVYPLTSACETHYSAALEVVDKSVIEV